MPFNAGLEESLDYAQSMRGDAPMHIDDEAYVSQIYLFLQKPPEEELPPDITVGDLSALPEGAAYVGPQAQVAALADQGYALKRFQEWAVALPSPQ